MITPTTSFLSTSSAIPQKGGSELTPTDNDKTQSMPPAIPIDLKIASRIQGEESMIATVELEPGQVLRAESGSMLYMTDGVQMETSLQGASNAFSRMLTGQNMFLTDFTYQGDTKGTVGLGTDFPSKILRLDLQDYADNTIVCQKGAYLASNPTVDISIETTKNLKAGFFGGEGFILQRLSGEGDVLIKGGGTIVNKTLKEGEKLRVTSGSLVAFESSVSYDVQMMPGIKNAMFGGEGLFVTTMEGPGQIWLQGMPPDRMIAEIARRVPGPGIGVGIPMMMGGGGGGEDAAPAAGDEVAAGAEAVAASDAAVEADRQATVATSDMPTDDTVDSESPSALFGDAVPKDATTTQGSPLDDDDDAFSNTTEPTFTDESSFGSNTNESSFEDDGDFSSDFDDVQDGQLFDDNPGSSVVDGGDEEGGTGSIISTLWDLFGGSDD